MSRRTFTPEQKAEAVALAAEIGLSHAADRLGYHRQTIHAWVKDAGVTLTVPEKTRAAVEALAADIDLRRVHLAAGLLDDIQSLRDELRAPAVQRIVKVVGKGDGRSAATIVDVELDSLPPADKARLMTAIAIAIDKVQVLTGKATVIHGAEPVADRTPETEAEVARVLSLVA